MRKTHFLLLGALAVLVLGATVQQMTTENVKDWPTATPKSTNTVLGVYDGGVARQFQLSTIGPSLATNTGTDGQALLRSGNSLKFGDVATSGGDTVWTNDETGYISGASNIAVRLISTTNTHLYVGSSAGDYAEAFGSKANDFGITMFESTNVQQTWGADFGLLADVDNAAFSAVTMSGIYDQSKITCSLGVSASGYAKDSLVFLQTEEYDVDTQNNVASLSLRNMAGGMQVELHSDKSNSPLIVRSNNVPMAMITRSGAFKTATTNALILPCPDGGSFILTVKNDGTLNIVTNSSGL